MKLPDVRRLVSELRLPAGDFALHGSGPLLAYGLVEEINDLDIVSRGAAWRYALTLAPAEHGRLDDVVRPLPGVEIFNGWLGDDADELIDGSRPVGDLPCVSLDAVLAFKRRLARPKDEAHIRLIEHYLRDRS